MNQSGKRRGPACGYLVFDIETEIDKELVAATLVPNAGSPQLAYEQLREEHDGGFLPLTVHRPVSVVLGWVSPGRVLERVEVLRVDEIGELELVRAFWHDVQRFDGTMVTFSGRIFDWPVMELRAMKYRVSLPWYFSPKSGLRGRAERHWDLYDILSNRGAARLRGGLDLLAKLVGLPGKGAVSGADVQGLWEQGQYDIVHRYCRRDVIQTYFLFLHTELLRGQIDAAEFARIEDATKVFRQELDAT